MLISQERFECWRSRKSWQYRMFAYSYQNELWHKTVPNQFGLCAFFRRAIIFSVLRWPIKFLCWLCSFFEKDSIVGKSIDWYLTFCADLFPHEDDDERRDATKYASAGFGTVLFVLITLAAVPLFLLPASTTYGSIVVGLFTVGVIGFSKSFLQRDLWQLWLVVCACVLANIQWIFKGLWLIVTGAIGNLAESSTVMAHVIVEHWPLTLMMIAAFLLATLVGGVWNFTGSIGCHLARNPSELDWLNLARMIDKNRRRDNLVAAVKHELKCARPKLFNSKTLAPLAASLAFDETANAITDQVELVMDKRVAKALKKSKLGFKQLCINYVNNPLKRHVSSVANMDEEDTVLWRFLQTREYWPKIDREAGQIVRTLLKKRGTLDIWHRLTSEQPPMSEPLVGAVGSFFTVICWPFEKLIDAIVEFNVAERFKDSWLEKKLGVIGNAIGKGACAVWDLGAMIVEWLIAWKKKHCPIIKFKD